MNSEEALSVLREQLAKYRRRRYVELVPLVGVEMPTEVIKGPSGAEYQIELLVVWDGKPHGNIRVIGMIDDGGLRAFVPLSADFITGPDDVVSD